MKINTLLRILLFCVVIFSGVNFLPQFKISQIPIFQFFLILTLIVFSIINGGKNFSPIYSLKYYKYYIISTIPSFVLGLVFNGIDSLLIFVYAFIPFFLFKYTYRNINTRDYVSLLFALNISMIIIVSIGWLLRLSIIPMNTLFEVTLPEFKLGYWGIRYLTSTRNHDYLYALVGLSISLFFFISGKKKLLSLLLVLFFDITLIASLSRAAIVVVTISLILLFRKSTKTMRLLFVSFFLLAISININLVRTSFDNNYKGIIFSIFELKNKASRFSNADRIEVIGTALSTSVFNPVGVGINNYSSIYKQNTGKRVSNSSENAFLTILVERGWIAFIFFILTFKSLYDILLKSKNYSLSYFLLPFLTIYFIFNYELNNSFACFLFYILFLDTNFIIQSNKCTTQNL